MVKRAAPRNKPRKITKGESKASRYVSYRNHGTDKKVQNEKFAKHKLRSVLAVAQTERRAAKQRKRSWRQLDEKPGLRQALREFDQSGGYKLPGPGFTVPNHLPGVTGNLLRRFRLAYEKQNKLPPAPKDDSKILHLMLAFRRTGHFDAADWSPFHRRFKLRNDDGKGNALLSARQLLALRRLLIQAGIEENPGPRGGQRGGKKGGRGRRPYVNLRDLKKRTVVEEFADTIDCGAFVLPDQAHDPQAPQVAAPAPPPPSNAEQPVPPPVVAPPETRTLEGDVPPSHVIEDLVAEQFGVVESIRSLDMVCDGREFMLTADQQYTKFDAKYRFYDIRFECMTPKFLMSLPFPSVTLGLLSSWWSASRHCNDLAPILHKVLLFNLTLAVAALINPVLFLTWVFLTWLPLLFVIPLVVIVNLMRLSRYMFIKSGKSHGLLHTTTEHFIPHLYTIAKREINPHTSYDQALAIVHNTLRMQSNFPLHEKHASGVAFVTRCVEHSYRYSNFWTHADGDLTSDVSFRLGSDLRPHSGTANSSAATNGIHLATEQTRSDSQAPVPILMSSSSQPSQNNAVPISGDCPPVSCQDSPPSAPIETTTELKQRDSKSESSDQRKQPDQVSSPVYASLFDATSATTITPPTLWDSKSGSTAQTTTPSEKTSFEESIRNLEAVRHRTRHKSSHSGSLKATKKSSISDGSTQDATASKCSPDLSSRPLSASSMTTLTSLNTSPCHNETPLLEGCGYVVVDITPPTTLHSKSTSHQM